MPATLSHPVGSTRTHFDPRRFPGPTSFSPLPDPVGFAGNFAAELGGQLVTGGGSQFPDKPLWLGGQKLFTDRIFALPEPLGLWKELSTRLPRAMAHFAHAADDSTAYVAGGTDESELLKGVYAVQSSGSDVTISALPDLPRPLMAGTAAVANGRLFVVGGRHDLAVKIVSPECWSISLDAATGEDAWRREPDLPGTGVFLGAMASCGGDLFHFGGVTFDGSGKSIQLRTAYRLRSGESYWEELPDLPEARVGAVTPCPVLAGNRILILGGYAAAFPGEPREHPGFSRQSFIYDIDAEEWGLGPLCPREPPKDRDATGDRGPAPVVAAPGTIWRNHFVTVGGEVRASTRTNSVLAYPLDALNAGTTPPR